MVETARAALPSLGVDLDQLRKLEPDAALGNGGLGRLAACYMDSMAALAVPAFGYGIRYEHGLFTQQIRDGWQHEMPERWLAFGNPWEFERLETEYSIRFGGTVEYVGGAQSDTARGCGIRTSACSRWRTIRRSSGWRGRHVNALRLWSARVDHAGASGGLQPGRFRRRDGAARAGRGDLARALSERRHAGRPGAAAAAGVFLHLGVAAGHRAPPSRAVRAISTSLPEHAAIQLNDTHPAIAVAELMRILVDEHDHRLGRRLADHQGDAELHQPHAAAGGAGELAGRAAQPAAAAAPADHLPDQLAAPRGRDGQGHRPIRRLLASISLIQEGHDKRVRMGHLAFVGSHKINGVSALHTELMRKTVFRDLDRAMPGRIVNKTNGISFRRWLFEANPALTSLLTGTLGERVLDDPDELLRARAARRRRRLSSSATPPTRARNKERAGAAHPRAGRASRSTRPRCSTSRSSAFTNTSASSSTSSKPIALYHAIRAEPERDWAPRVKIFAGKAAASYERAKLIIKLANDVARVINTDPHDRRPAEGGVPAELQRQPGRGDHSGRRPVRADFDRRHGGLRHRQHEARAQRRADDRHAGRRQHRNLRARRGRATCSSSG